MLYLTNMPLHIPQLEVVYLVSPHACLSFHLFSFCSSCVCLSHNISLSLSPLFSPVLDAIRCLMLHHHALEVLGDDKEVRQQVLRLAPASDIHMAVSLKIIANWVARRKR